MRSFINIISLICPLRGSNSDQQQLMSTGTLVGVAGVDVEEIRKKSGALFPKRGFHSVSAPSFLTADRSVETSISGRQHQTRCTS